MSKQVGILVFDIGTTGVKSILFHETGKVMGTSTQKMKTTYPHVGWAEQDPYGMWQGVLRGIRQLKDKGILNTTDIVGIGLSGHMNGMIPVDAQGEPVYNEIIHSDNRSEQYCSYILDRIPLDNFFAITGNRVDSHFTLPKIIWFKQHLPNLYKKTKHIIQSKDFIRSRLIGMHYGVTDYSDASLTGALNFKKKTWAKDILCELGLDVNIFPHVRASHELAGTVSADAARMTGLKEGIPVYIGGGDAACSTRGAGIVAPGKAQLYVGSSAWISVLEGKPLIDSKRRLQNFYDLGGYLCNVCGTVQSAGVVREWASEVLGFSDKTKIDDVVSLYKFMDQQAKSSGIGARGIIFLPYLMGERTPYWDQNLQGAFVGLSLIHTRADMIRAIFEGVAYAIHSVLDVYKENSIFIEDLTLIGGGAESVFWCHIFCDVLHKPIHLIDSPRMATALGAAIAAGVGSGLFQNYESGAQIISLSHSIESNNEAHTQYKIQYEKFLRLYHPFRDLCYIMKDI